MARQCIEYPSVGATYHRDEFGVYEYDVYPPSSVLAGQTRRVWLDAFETLEAAKAAFPAAKVTDGCGYVEPSLNHLPDEGDDMELDEIESLREYGEL